MYLVILQRQNVCFALLILKQVIIFIFPKLSVIKNVEITMVMQGHIIQQYTITMVLQGHIIQKYKTTLGIQGHIIFKNRCNTIRRQIHKNFMYVQCIVNHCLFCCPFFSANVLSVLIRFTDSDYTFGIKILLRLCIGGRRGRDRIVVGFTNVESVPSTTKVLNSNPAHGEVYLI